MVIGRDRSWIPTSYATSGLLDTWCVVCIHFVECASRRAANSAYVFVFFLGNGPGRHGTGLGAARIVFDVSLEGCGCRSSRRKVG
jgi:hypothetical protein